MPIGELSAGRATGELSNSATLPPSTAKSAVGVPLQPASRGLHRQSRGQHDAPDLTTESRWGDYPGVAQLLGVAAVCSSPLIVGGHAVGMLNP